MGANELVESLLDGGKTPFELVRDMCYGEENRGLKGHQHESLTEDFTMTPAHRKVIDAFIDQKSAESNKLSSDGKRLDGLWMGGNNIAYWEGDKIKMGPLDSRSKQTIQHALKKATPKNLLGEATPFKKGGYSGYSLNKLYGLLHKSVTKGDTKEITMWHDELKMKGADMHLVDLIIRTGKIPPALKGKADASLPESLTEGDRKYKAGDVVWDDGYGLKVKIVKPVGSVGYRVLPIDKKAKMDRGEYTQREDKLMMKESDDSLSQARLFLDSLHESAGSTPKKGDKIDYGDEKLTVEIIYPTKADADGPLPSDLLRLMKAKGSSAVIAQGKQGPYVVYFMNGRQDGHPVWMKPHQYKRALEYEKSRSMTAGRESVSEEMSPAEKKAFEKGQEFARKNKFAKFATAKNSEELYQAAMKMGVSSSWFDVFKYGAQQVWRETGQLKKKEAVAEGAPDRPYAVEIKDYALWGEDGSVTRQASAIHKNYATKMASGQYNRDMAIKGMMNLVQSALMSYHKKNRMSGKWSDVIDMPTRKLCAELLVDDFEERQKEGEFASTLPKKYQQKKEEIDDLLNRIGTLLGRDVMTEAKTDQKKALLGLYRWATGQNRTGNPYGHPPVRDAIRALGDPDGYDIPEKKPSDKVGAALWDLATWATTGNKVGNPYMKPEVKAANKALGGDGINLPGEESISEAKKVSIKFTREEYILMTQSYDGMSDPLYAVFSSARGQGPADKDNYHSSYTQNIDAETLYNATSSLEDVMSHLDSNEKKIAKILIAKMEKVSEPHLESTSSVSRSELNETELTLTPDDSAEEAAVMEFLNALEAAQVPFSLDAQEDEGVLTVRWSDEHTTAVENALEAVGIEVTEDTSDRHAATFSGQPHSDLPSLFERERGPKASNMIDAVINGESIEDVLSRVNEGDLPWYKCSAERALYNADKSGKFPGDVAKKAGAKYVRNADGKDRDRYVFDDGSFLKYDSRFGVNKPWKWFEGSSND